MNILLVYRDTWDQEAILRGFMVLYGKKQDSSSRIESGI